MDVRKTSAAEREREKREGKREKRMEGKRVGRCVWVCVGENPIIPPSVPDGNSTMLTNVIGALVPFLHAVSVLTFVSGRL